MKLVWRSRPPPPSSIMTSTTNSVAPSATASNVNLTEKSAMPTTVTAAEFAAALGGTDVPRVVDEPPPSKWKWNWRLSKKRPSKATSGDVEKGPAARTARPIRLFAPVYGGLGLGLSAFFMASGVGTTLSEWRLDQDYSRFAVLATIPLLFCVSLVSFTGVTSTTDVLSSSVSLVLCPPNRVNSDIPVRSFCSPDMQFLMFFTVA
jgi:phosphate/sulfate permease